MSGTYRIINDDVINALKELEPHGEQFDALVMDPPYCSSGVVPGRTVGGVAKYVETKRNGSFSDSMTQTALYDFIREVVRRSLLVMRSRSYVFIFTDWRSYPVMASAMQGAGAIWRGAVTWNKERARPNIGHITQSSEFILWGTKGDEKSDKYHKSSVWTALAPPVRERVHPTQKPPEIYKEIYKILPDSPDVLDLFAGSAPAGVAALEVGGNYTGVELSPQYATASDDRLRRCQQKLFE